MSSEGFEAVIFDCDGVLVDTEVITNDIWVEMAAELGAAVDPKQMMDRIRGAAMHTSMQWLAGELNRELPDDFEAVFRGRAAERFRRDLEPIAGVVELLGALQVPYCVASNGPRHKMNVSLNAAGLMPYFEDRIVSAYEVGLFKPDPGLYLAAAEGLAVESSRCAVIEDSLPGVQAGIAAGMTVFGFSQPETEGPLAAAGAITFESMFDLPRLLEQGV
jgi:HAD superfamily hydrolase (TIGR01509 family)